MALAVVTALQLYLCSHCQHIFSFGMGKSEVLKSGSNLVVFLDLVNSSMKIKSVIPS